MIKKIYFFLVFILFAFVSTPVLAQDKSTVPQNQVEFRLLDKRARILQSYLAKYNSPLQDQAQNFIEAADIYKLDWKLVPSIAGVESTFGKFIPGGYNAWGWGVYGNQAIYFKSWKEGIFTVSEGLRKNYFDKGLTNPYIINKVYAASPTWGAKVSYFLNDLEQFEKQYQDKEEPSLPDLNHSIAGASAQITLK